VTIYLEAIRPREYSVAALGLVLFIAVYAALAAFLYPGPFVNLASIYAGTFARAIPIIVFTGLAIMSLIVGRAAPTRYILDRLRERWAVLAVVSVVFFLGLTAYSTYKTAIPYHVPFYADQWLADADKWLLGQSAWRLAHRIDSDLWALFIFVCYENLWFIQWFGTVFFSAFWACKTARIRYLWAVSLTLCICGTILATLLASVGPIFYYEFTGEPRYQEFHQVLSALPFSDMINEPAAYLLATYRAGEFSLGTGISAMPSVHVALAVLNAYLLSSVNRWAGTIGWSFAALIFYGSVYTGFHYALDGVVSIVVVSAIWWATGRFVTERSVGEP
jgi:hypothetical protein